MGVGEKGWRDVASGMGIDSRMSLKWKMWVCGEGWVWVG